MPPKNGSSAGDADDQAKLYSVKLVKPARINGETYEAGEIVKVDETVGRQLEHAGAIDLPETAELNNPTDTGQQA